MRANIRRIFLLVTICFSIFWGCQNSSESELQVDDDMAIAIRLINEFVAIQESKRASTPVVTVLQYREGKLLFATQDDGFRAYREVTEETVTAILKQGDQVFWFAGSGILEIVDIEFDKTSHAAIGSKSQGVFNNRLWTIRIPRNLDENTVLKYDIVYRHGDNPNDIVRLDPKLKVGQGDPPN